MDTPETFEQYIERVRAHRADLRESVAAVDDALAEPISKPSWRQRVQAALAELTHDFTDHISLTEQPNGIYDTVRQTQERLSPAVDELVAEHARLASEIESALARIDGEPSGVNLREFREEVSTLVGKLVRHRQRGGDLVYEAYNVDLGGQG